MFAYLQHIYKKYQKNDCLRFQMISKADETRVFYFSLSSRQVVLVAVGNIFKGVYSSTSDGQVVLQESDLLPVVCHTIVSEFDPFPVKKSQKLVTGDVLLSSCGVCLTQMLLSVEPLRLEQLPLWPTLSEKPSWPLRSWH